MKNKGFTIVEMLSAFILSSIIIIIMFQLIINLKEIYQSSGIKTEMLNKKYIMTNKIYTDLNEKTLITIQSCGTSCLDLTYATGEIKRLSQNINNRTITYDDYTIKINSGFEISNMQTELPTETEQSLNKLIKINIPIVNTNDEDYSINIIYTYKGNQVSLNK